jgi:hypothetical protein
MDQPQQHNTHSPARPQGLPLYIDHRAQLWAALRIPPA